MNYFIEFISLIKVFLTEFMLWFWVDEFDQVVQIGEFFHVKTPTSVETVRNLVQTMHQIEKQMTLIVFLDDSHNILVTEKLAIPFYLFLDDTTIF